MKTFCAIVVACISSVAFAQGLDFIACCPAPHNGQIVVNADQTVILIWNPQTKTEHFIRKASFKSEGDDFGFIIPTPSAPELDESGNEAFKVLEKLTAPEELHETKWVGPSLGCGEMKTTTATRGGVHVLQEKLVAGFNAVVLEATSANLLAKWLSDHGFELSPEIETWAKPYIDGGWKFTALKVAKDAAKASYDRTRVDAGALRLSFKTDRPLFPYREPDYKGTQNKLYAYDRLLRIFFISDARYEGALTKDHPWTGKAVWAGNVQADSLNNVVGLLKIPGASVPANAWLTVFDDHWPYEVAPADLYFSQSAIQSILRRPPLIHYHYRYVPVCELSCLAFVALTVAVAIRAWRRRRMRAA